MSRRGHYSWDAHAKQLSAAESRPITDSPSAAPRRTRFAGKAESTARRALFTAIDNTLLWVMSEACAEFIGNRAPPPAASSSSARTGLPA